MGLGFVTRIELFLEEELLLCTTGQLPEWTDGYISGKENSEPRRIGDFWPTTACHGNVSTFQSSSTQETFQSIYLMLGLASGVRRSACSLFEGISSRKCYLLSTSHPLAFV
jgi:hypothetical protein